MGAVNGGDVNQAWHSKASSELHVFAKLRVAAGSMTRPLMFASFTGIIDPGQNASDKSVPTRRVLPAG